MRISVNTIILEVLDIIFTICYTHTSSKERFLSFHPVTFQLSQGQLFQHNIHME